MIQILLAPEADDDLGVQGSIRLRGPASPLSFVARDNDVRLLVEALRRADTARTLLVTGPAGVGKTAVVESARQTAIREGVKVLRLGRESAEGECAGRRPP